MEKNAWAVREMKQRGEIFLIVKEKTQKNLNLGEKYIFMKEYNEKVIMKLVKFYENFAVFEAENGTKESFLYQDIYFKLLQKREEK